MVTFVEKEMQKEIVQLDQENRVLAHNQEWLEAKVRRLLDELGREDEGVYEDSEEDEPDPEYWEEMDYEELLDTCDELQGHLNWDPVPRSVYEGLSHEELVEKARELQGYVDARDDEVLFGHLPLKDDEPELDDDDSNHDYYQVERIPSIQPTPITGEMDFGFLKRRKQERLEQAEEAARLQQKAAVTTPPLPQTERSVAAVARILARRALKEVLP